MESLFVFHNGGRFHSFPLGVFLDKLRVEFLDAAQHGLDLVLLGENCRPETKTSNN